MSQWGEIEDINLVRDNDTGKSLGFCFVKYEDQRSTILAVDNFNGISLLDRTLRCDHVDKYKLPKEIRQREEEAIDEDPLKDINIGPGHAYIGKELANDVTIEKGVNPWAKPPSTTASRAKETSYRDVERESKFKKSKKEKKRKKDDKKEKKEKKKHKSHRDDKSGSRHRSSSAGGSEGVATAPLPQPPAHIDPNPGISLSILYLFICVYFFFVSFAQILEEVVPVVVQWHLVLRSPAPRPLRGEVDMTPQHMCNRAHRMWEEKRGIIHQVLEIEMLNSLQ